MTKKKSSNFLLEFIDRIYPYKISIFFITLIGMVISAINLYLQPSIYEAKAVLKVKTQDNQILREFNSAEQYSKQSDNIDQDLAILQTYYIHKNAIEKLNLNVQYFIKKRYKDRAFR